MTSTTHNSSEIDSDVLVEDKPATAKNRARNPELFSMGSSSRSRALGLFTVVALIFSGTFTFMMLMDLTPIKPNRLDIVLGAAALNGILLLMLMFLVGREVYKILSSRRKGRAASRLHVRIIGLFCLVAGFPAVLVAIIAGITLDLGLDRWFENRTKNLIQDSVSIARAYKNESTRVLLGNTLSMAANLDRSRRLYVLDRQRFAGILTLEAQGRGFIYSALLNDKGEEIMRADIPTERELPRAPGIAIELANDGKVIPIPPGNTNLIGAVFKMKEVPNAYLYSIIAIPKAVIEGCSRNRIEQRCL